MQPNGVWLLTNEGPDAVTEAIEVIERGHGAQLPALTWSDGLALAAQDHVKDTGKRGMTGHEGSDGSLFFQRMARYGTAEGHQGENISYGPKTAVEVVM